MKKVNLNIFLEKIFLNFYLYNFFFFRIRLSTKKQIIKIYIIIISDELSYIYIYIFIYYSATSDSIIFSYYIIDYVIRIEKKILTYTQ